MGNYHQKRGKGKLPIFCGNGEPVIPIYAVKDHRKARNPYYSRYGDKWVEKLKSSSSMSKFCCITDLIRFMMKEAGNLMKGSVHEDDFFIVHDALVLMTAEF